MKILIASPSDVAAERKIVAEEIAKWNIVNRELHGIELEAVMWETHAHAASGERAQGILNAQIVDQCDFAIAMFHARIGTDTGVAPGGAVEEVQRLLQQKKQVMCWFSEMPLPHGVDLDQVKAVRDFRDKMQLDAVMFERRVDQSDGLIQELCEIKFGEDIGGAFVEREQAADFRFKELQLAVCDFEGTIGRCAATALMNLERQRDAGDAVSELMGEPGNELSDELFAFCLQELLLEFLKFSGERLDVVEEGDEFIVLSRVVESVCRRRGLVASDFCDLLLD